MSRLPDAETRALIHGIACDAGRFHTAQMIEYGTHVVAGVTPGHGGESCLDRPVYETVREAVAETHPTAACIFTSPETAADAALEALEAGIEWIVIPTHGVPALDMIRVYWEARRRGARVLGSGSPGLIAPAARLALGVMPGHGFTPGRVGLISRSPSLIYEFADALTRAGWGQSVCIGLGKDSVIGEDAADMLPLLLEDPDTDAVVWADHAGGAEPTQLNETLAQRGDTPVIAFVAGASMPAERGGRGGVAERVAALRHAGATICDGPDHIGEIMRQTIG